MQKAFLLFVVFSISFCLKSVGQIYYYPIDSCNFDNGICSQIAVSTDTQNIFQIGAPHKLFFGNAYSQPNAIMTDSIHPYKKNNFSYFDYKFKMGMEGFRISFVHKYQTDTMRDGGYLLLSADTGKSWAPLGDIYAGGQNRGNFKNDTVCNRGKYAFTGNSNGWENFSTGYLFYLFTRTSSNQKPNPFDTIIIRFCFVSDSIDNQKAGWIIDDFKVDAEFEPGGIQSTSSQIPLTISPNPSSSNFNLTTSETIAAKGFGVSVTNLLGENIFSKNEIHQSHFKIDTQQFPAGIYFLKTHCNGYADANEKIVVER